jgi:hypothetical protein
MQSLMGYMAGTTFKSHVQGVPRGQLKKLIARMANGVLEDNTQRLLLLETLRDEVLNIRSTKSAEMAARYDKKVHAKEFEVGDEILLYDATLLKQWSRKLEE